MTWIAASQQERREQLGRFLLGTGGIGGIAGATGPGLGLSDSEGLALIDRAVEEGFKVLDTADMYTGGNSEHVVGTWNRPRAGVASQPPCRDRAGCLGEQGVTMAGHPRGLDAQVDR